MIESTIIYWIDQGDSMQTLEVYSQKKLVILFNFFRVLMNNKTFSIFIYLILKFFFFLQIVEISIIAVKTKDDSTIIFLSYLQKIACFQNLVTNSKSYEIAIILISALGVLAIFCTVFIFVSMRFGKFITKIPIYLFNLLNIMLMHYLIGPIIHISLMTFECSGGVHKFLNVACYRDIKHIIFLVLTLLWLVFFILISIGFSFYCNEIGSINRTNVCARTNCNYEIYINISKIIMFVVSYFIENHSGENKIYQIILTVYVFLNCLLFSFYVYHCLFFTDNKMNIITQFGWVFVTWFSFVIGLKVIFNLKDTLIFHLAGFVILGISVHLLIEHKKTYLITDFNIFEAKSLKDIQLFNSTLFELLAESTAGSKTLLVGIVKKFEELAENTPDIAEKLSKLRVNDHLKKKYINTSALSILSIIFIVYDHHLEKSALKNDILLNMCYFLMNKFKNTTFAINLLSKFRVVNHKHLYYKYVLMEDIKDFLVNKLAKSNNKESIKNVQIGSVILYNIFMDLFKMKIYDAASSQVEYFDFLKSSNTSSKTTENFLKTGDNILNLRSEILKIWEKILELNPFSDESEKDYMLYLELILQEETLARTEKKKYDTLKTNKLPERNNIYHSMFQRDTSSIILVDGYSSNGKILYVTPNFPSNYNFNDKEILNMSIDELLPNVVATFHKELMDDALKFSNITYTFNRQKDMLLKGKNSGGIFNIKLFVKCVPNLTYGLIYFAHITKVLDHNFIIVLDKDYKINGLTDIMAQGGGQQNQPLTMNNNYGLTPGLCGHHISTVIPEILLQLEYKNNQFSIAKTDIDLKGSLYPTTAMKEIDNKIDRVLEKIKHCGKLQNEDLLIRDNMQEYDDLVKDINQKYTKPFSVFYKIVNRSFLNGKHKYYRIYITNDLIALNENSHAGKSLMMSKSESKKKVNKRLSSNDKKNKIIKLKSPDGLSENKGLLDGDKKDEEGGENKERKGDENDSNKNNENEKNVSKKQSVQTSSLNTSSSMDSTSFKKVKASIMEKQEIFNIRMLKYICIFFGLSTILLIVLNSVTIESNFNELNEYLQENIFFNHSKISVSCIYLATVNLKWVKDENVGRYTCELIGSKDCSLFYSNLLETCINDLNEQKVDSSYFYQDFKKILAKTKEIKLDVFNLTLQDELYIDMDNLLNLIITNGLQIISNIDTYFAENDTEKYNVYDTNSNNIRTQSVDYLDDDEVAGFSDKNKEKNISDQFTPLPIYLIIEIILFACLITLFGYLIFKLNDMEMFYLEKLIKFHSVNFDNYLKQLEDLKKKMKTENGDDEEKVNADADEEGGSKKSKKEEGDDDKEEGTHTKKKKKLSKDKDKANEGENNEGEKEKEGAHKKKRKNKGKLQTKLQQQRIEKKKIMSRYFFRYNLSLIFKAFAVLIIAISYFLVITLLESSKRNSYLEFDSTTNSIEGVFKSSFDIFLQLKKEMSYYEESKYSISQVNKSLAESATYRIQPDGTMYTCTLQKINECPLYNMNIPENNEITTPKLGNVLMPLTSDTSSGAPEQTSELNSLYNSDACAVLFEDRNSIDFTFCETFWSSILIKGMEQSITQMSVVINTVIDELHSLRLGDKAFSDLVATDSSFSEYELFVEYYLLKAYLKTIELFTVLKAAKVSGIFNSFRIILYAYIVGVIILFFVLLYFVHNSKILFSSFFNFIGILPSRFLQEDKILFDYILKLEEQMY